MCLRCFPDLLFLGVLVSLVFLCSVFSLVFVWCFPWCFVVFLGVFFLGVLVVCVVICDLVACKLAVQ